MIDTEAKLNAEISEEIKLRSKQLIYKLLLIEAVVWIIWIGFDAIYAGSLLSEFIAIRIFFSGFAIVTFFIARKNLINEPTLHMFFILPPLLVVSYFFNVVDLAVLYYYFIGATLVLLVAFLILVSSFIRSLIIACIALISIILFHAILKINSLESMLTNGGLIYASICLFGVPAASIRFKSKFDSIRNEFLLKQSNEKLKEIIKEREILLKEIHHRVKNNLQIISSMIKLQEDQINEKNAVEILKLSQDRIRSLSIIHECLYKLENFNSLDFETYVQKLGTYYSDVYDFDERQIKLSYKIEKVEIEIDKMIPCGLIINEIITNSIKHAFRNKASGKIDIVSSVENNELCLSISDDGIGCVFSQLNEANSLGIRLIKGLVNQLQGTVSFESSEGFCVQCKFNIR